MVYKLISLFNFVALVVLQITADAKEKNVQKGRNVNFTELLENANSFV